MTSLWQPSVPDTLETHRFSEGVAVYNPRNKSTSYLPDPAGAVFDILLHNPQGLTETNILQWLKTTSRPDEDTLLSSIDELTAVLVALEEQHLISSASV